MAGFVFLLIVIIFIAIFAIPLIHFGLIGGLIGSIVSVVFLTLCFKDIEMW